jgi:hypothetical protein
MIACRKYVVSRYASGVNRGAEYGVVGSGGSGGSGGTSTSATITSNLSEWSWCVRWRLVVVLLGLASSACSSVVVEDHDAYNSAAASITTGAPAALPAQMIGCAKHLRTASV